MKIKSIRISKKFRYLWLKEITGVDLSVHCAKSLLGEYNTAVSNKIEYAENIPLSGNIYYLCGVALPYVWANNFHLAFRRKEGGNFHYESNGVEVVLEGAERIEFSQADVDTTLPQAKKKEFYTCRNWQFANKLFRELYK